MSAEHFTSPPPAWLPDWRRPDAYIDHGDDAVAWAWEFLRRNPEYRKDYSRFAALPDSEIDEQGRSNWTPKWKGGADDDDMIFFHVERDQPSPMPGETAGQYENRTGNWPPPLRVHLEEYWGLTHLVDPDKDDYILPRGEGAPPVFLYQFQSHGEPFKKYDVFYEQSLGGPRDWERRELIHASWPEKDDGYMFAVAFDTRFPLEAQFEVIRQTIKKQNDDFRALLESERAEYGKPIHDESDIEQKRPPATRFGKMLDYLRVYDAIWADGWNRKEIADVLFPYKSGCESVKSALQSVDDARRVALKYVDSGWRDLIKWADYPKNLNKKPKN